MTSERAVEPRGADRRKAIDDLYAVFAPDVVLEAEVEAILARIVALDAATPAPREDGWEEPEVADVPALREVVARAEAAGNAEWAKGLRYATEWLRPFLAAARGEPPEREPYELADEHVLARFYKAIDTVAPHDYEIILPVGLLRRASKLIWNIGHAAGNDAGRRQLVEEQAALATPTTPEPDPRRFRDYPDGHPGDVDRADCDCDCHISGEDMDSADCDHCTGMSEQERAATPEPDPER